MTQESYLYKLLKGSFRIALLLLCFESIVNKLFDKYKI